MQKYERQCWSCGSRDVVNKGSYTLCSQCGATWNVVPKMGALPLTITDDEAGGVPRPGRTTHASPSRITQRRAARARGDQTASPAPE